MRTASCCLGLALVTVLLATTSSSQQSRVFQVSRDPDIRYWWDDVPKSVKRSSLSTADFSNIEPADFMGPQACKTCHEDKYQRWSQHRHRFMNAPATEATIKGDFSGHAFIDYFGGRATFARENDRYVMRLVRGDTGRTYHVTQTIGSRFFQYYVGLQIEGPEPMGHRIYRSEHVLPFGYWLDYTQWVPVVHVEKTREGEPSLIDAMRRDPFTQPAVHDYAQSCSQCHTTMPTGDWLIHRQPSFPMSPLGFSFDLRSYVADNHAELLAGKDPSRLELDDVQELLLRITHKKAPVWELTSGISCETCHYGNRAHVESGGAILPRMFPTSPRLFIDGTNPAVDLARNPVNQNWTCGRCHQGTRFEYAAGMGTWNSTEYSDAMKGACYRFDEPERAMLRCIDCHNPHETTGKAWSRTPDEDDGLCLKCHTELEPEPARVGHTRHPMGSTGSRCMNCHMPRINEGLQAMVRTHMIFSPTKREMIEANQPNACNMCHVRETLAWTVAKLEQWYGAQYEATEIESTTAATLEWLRSWHPTTQMVAADVLTKARADWALPELFDALDSKYMLVRQFAQIGLDDMLETRLAHFGYRFYMFEDEREASLEALVEHYLLDGTTTRIPEQSEAEEVEHYRQLVRFKPDSSTAHYYLANALFPHGGIDEAMFHYRRAIEIDAGFARAYNNLGVALKEEGRIDEAAAEHRKALSLEPRLPDAHIALGNVLVLQGRSDDAAASFRRAIGLEPDRAEAHYNLGLVHQAAERTQDAMASYRRAIAIEPRYGEALNNLGIALASLGRQDEAIEAFEQAISTEDAATPSAQNNLGWALKLAGRLDDAMEHFEAALAADPESISAQVGLSGVLASHDDPRRRDPERAIRLAESAAGATDEQSAEVLDTLSQAYAAAGHFERAAAAAEKAVRLAPPDEALARAIRARLAEYRSAR